MPAAAVIPAPIVYIKVAAVKKLVVGLRSGVQCHLGWSGLRIFLIILVVVHRCHCFCQRYLPFVHDIDLLFYGNLGVCFLFRQD